MLASLTGGDCVINNISTGDDVERTRKCLSDCGIRSEKRGTTVLLKGGGLESPKIPLNCFWRTPQSPPKFLECLADRFQRHCRQSGGNSR